MWVPGRGAGADAVSGLGRGWIHRSSATPEVIEEGLGGGSESGLGRRRERDPDRWG